MHQPNFKIMCNNKKNKQSAVGLDLTIIEGNPKTRKEPLLAKRTDFTHIHYSMGCHFNIFHY